MDFGWTIRLIDGLSTVLPAVAQELAEVTNSKPQHWMEKGQGPVRLMAVKAWALKEERRALPPRPSTEKFLEEQMRKRDLEVAVGLAARLGRNLVAFCPADCSGIDCAIGFPECLVQDITTIRTSLEDKLQEAVGHA